MARSSAIGQDSLTHNTPTLQVTPPDSAQRRPLLDGTSASSYFVNTYSVVIYAQCALIWHMPSQSLAGHRHSASLELHMSALLHRSLHMVQPIGFSRCRQVSWHQQTC